MKNLIRLLKKNKKVSAWKITALETESCELFFVGKKLETNRATKVADYNVAIYVDKDGLRGTGTFTYYPYMDDKQIQEKIDEALFASQFTMNKFFDIPAPEKVDMQKDKTNLKRRPFSAIINDVQKAIFKADKYHDGYLSATEIFLYKITTHIYNSKGVKLSYVTYKGNIESIPAWKKKDDEVELYNMISFSSYNGKDITKQIKEILLLAKARAKAKALKAKRLPEDINIIIEGEEVEQLFDSFASDLNYVSKYYHRNHYELGDSVQGEDIKGDKINLKVVPTYPNAMDSSPVDGDGVILKEVELIKDGKAINNYGSYRFGYYLNIDKPTGQIPVVVVEEGKTSFEEMKQKPYIRCVRFSGMQLDPDSGFIGGEVRLAFYFDGKKEVPVTGFSISGDIHEVKKEFTFSKETITRPHYHGPRYVLLRKMHVI